MQIEQLDSNQWQRLRALRLRSLQEAPDAFASTFADASDIEESGWRAQLESLATFAAVTDGADVGIVRGSTDKANPAAAWLLSMWVAPEARGLGVGQRLIQAVARWAHSTGHTHMLLDVADDNSAAVRLYAQQGFEPTGEKGSLPPPREHVKEHRRRRDLTTP